MQVEFTYCHIWCSSDVGHWSSFSGGGEPCHQGLCSFPKDAFQCVGFDPFQLCCMSCVVELSFLSICLSCDCKVTLCELLASLMNWLSPLCVGGLLELCLHSLMCQFVPYWVGLQGPCLPIDMTGYADTLSPFAISVMLMLMYWALPAHWCGWVC